jgi:hypothetical protein
MRRALIGGFGLLAAQLVSPGSTGAAPPSDADLRIESAPVPADANGFLRLGEAAAAIRLASEERARIGGPTAGAFDPAEAERIAAANEAALGLLDSAIRAPGFASGRLRDAGPEIEAWRALANLSALRAGVRARAGDATGAIADATAPIALGRRLAADPHCGIGCAVGAFALKRIGTGALAAALPLLRPSADESRALVRTIAGGVTDPAAWRATWAVEYQRMKNAFGRPNDSEAAELALAAAQFRVIRAQVGGPCAAWLRPRGSGLLRIGDFDFAVFEIKRCFSDTDVAAAEALVALRAYAVEHGGLPATLDALVPRYLDAVPLDAFDGTPLRFDPERRLLRSVGSDLEIGRDPASKVPAHLGDPTFTIGF